MRRYRSRSGRHLVAYISALLCMQRGEVETKVCSILCGARNHCLLPVVRSGARSGVPASSAQLLHFRFCGPEAPTFCLFLRLLLPMLRIRGVADAPERLIEFKPAQHVLGSEIAERHLHQGDVRRSDVIGGLGIGGLYSKCKNIKRGSYRKI